MQQGTVLRSLPRVLHPAVLIGEDLEAFSIRMVFTARPCASVGLSYVRLCNTDAASKKSHTITL